MEMITPVLGKVKGIQRTFFFPFYSNLNDFFPMKLKKLI